jgi:hypothetical protein
LCFPEDIRHEQFIAAILPLSGYASWGVAEKTGKTIFK